MEENVASNYILLKMVRSTFLFSVVLVLLFLNASIQSNSVHISVDVDVEHAHTPHHNSPENNHEEIAEVDAALPFTSTPKCRAIQGLCMQRSDCVAGHIVTGLCSGAFSCCTSSSSPQPHNPPPH
jgi:hypothetical protein